MPKYTLKINELMKESNIHKLERDGFTRHDIHRVLYREAGDATNTERTKIMQDLYNRKEKIR